MAQRKQREQLILTNDKNIFAYCFQLIERLQPNLKNDSTRNFMYTKHKGDNAKLKYSLSYRNDNLYNPILWIIHTKQLNIQTQPKQPKQPHQRLFHH